MTVTPAQDRDVSVLAIDCQGLTYAFSEGLESALEDVELKLERGDRCLLVGANGGGFGTLPPVMLYPIPSTAYVLRWYSTA